MYANESGENLMTKPPVRIKIVFLAMIFSYCMFDASVYHCNIILEGIKSKINIPAPCLDFSYVYNLYMCNFMIKQDKNALPTVHVLTPADKVQNRLFLFSFFSTVLRCYTLDVNNDG